MWKKELFSYFLLITLCIIGIYGISELFIEYSVNNELINFHSANTFHGTSLVFLFGCMAVNIMFFVKVLLSCENKKKMKK